MISLLMILGAQLTAPPSNNDLPPPAYITTTTAFSCKGEERSISVRAVGRTLQITEIRSGGRKLPDPVWRDIQKTVANFDSIGEPDPVCSARGDMVYLTAYRGTEGHTLTLTFSGGSAILAEPR